MFDSLDTLSCGTCAGCHDAGSRYSRASVASRDRPYPGTRHHVSERRARYDNRKVLTAEGGYVRSDRPVKLPLHLNTVRF